MSKYDFATIVEPQTDKYGGARRAIVIGGRLWSTSAAGVQINALNGLAQQSRPPF